MYIGGGMRSSQFPPKKFLEAKILFFRQKEEKGDSQKSIFWGFFFALFEGKSKNITVIQDLELCIDEVQQLSPLRQTT